MSDQSPRELLLEWLKEAHAFAQHGESMLSARADDLGDYPKLAERLSAHAKQTKEQAERIAECIERMGADTSTARDIAGKLSAKGHSLGMRMTGEQAVQAHAASYAFEHFEIANYRAIIAVAERAGESAVKSTCEGILEEQREMAEWLDAHLDETAKQFVEADR